MRPTFPTVEQVSQLPTLTNQSIPAEWEDYNGHVNIQFYMTLYERGGWPMVADFGLDDAYFSERRCGLFDLEHHVFYLAELHVGDEVSVHCRLVGQTPKRFHGVMFIVNRSRTELASTLEFTTSGANLDTRRAAPFPDDVAAAITATVKAHEVLPWAVPVCGVMSA